MLRSLYHNINGVQALSFSLLHGFRRLLRYTTSSSPEAVQSLANYLVDSLGFSKGQSLSTATKLAQQRLAQGASKAFDFKVATNADEVIHFLMQNGFDQSQIRNIVHRVPRVLLCRVEKTLKPKFDFFNKLGLSGSYLVQYISVKSRILVKSLDSDIIPAIKAFREVLGSNVDMTTLFKKSTLLRILPAIVKHLEPNVTLMQKHGVSIELIRKHICRQPSAFVRSPELMEEIFVRVEKLGIPPNSPMFLYAVRLLSSLSERAFDNRVKLFESFGWANSDVLALIRRFPCCFWCSESRIKKSLDFYRKELGYEPADLIKDPNLLSCSLENRIVPRHRILLVLKEKGLIRKDYPLTFAVRYTESAFLKKFVLPFKEVYEVYSKHTGHPVRPDNSEECTKIIPLR